MKSAILFFLILLVCLCSKAQTGINTTSPAASSIVEMASADKGVLLPRVSLASITDVATISSPADALTVFNTATAGTVPNNVVPGYYYWSAGLGNWVRLLDATSATANIYSADGSLTGNRTVAQGANTLNFTGSATNAFSVDNATFSADAANHRVGIGTTSPGAKLEIASGTANTSGLKFTNFNSSTPIGTGQTIGVDASGNVITMPNPTPSVVTTVDATSTTASTFQVNAISFTTIPNSAQSITIPIGGRALFINFMLGISYGTAPSNSGGPYQEVCLFIDGVQTNAYLVTQQSLLKNNNNPGQFSIFYVTFLAAGAHAIDARMIRSFANGVPNTANITCTMLSLSFNASYLN